MTNRKFHGKEYAPVPSLTAGNIQPLASPGFIQRKWTLNFDARPVEASAEPAQIHPLKAWFAHTLESPNFRSQGQFFCKKGASQALTSTLRAS